MTAKKVRKMVLELPTEEDEPEDKSVSEQEIDDAVDRAEEEQPTKVESRIFRRHPLTGNREMFTDTVDSDVVTADFLKQTYGGGYYRVQVIGPVKKGKAGKPGRGVLKILRFEVDLSIPPKHPAQATTPPSAMPNAPQGASALDATVATMLTTMLTQMQNASAAQAAQMSTLSTMQMQMMKDHSTMLAAQLAHLAPKPERDPLEVLKEAASIIRPNEKSSFGDFLEQYKLFKEIAGDAEAKDTSWLDVIKEVAPSLIDRARSEDAATRRVRGRHDRGDSRILSAGTAETPSEGGTVVQEGSEGDGARAVTPPNVNPNLRFITPIMPRVIKWATQGKDATLCAEWLMSDIPAGFYPMLREQLSSLTFMPDVVAAFPQAEPFQPWIEKLRQTLIEATSPDDEETGDEGDEGDDEAE